LQDYYKILEVDFDASEEAIRSSYIRLALVSVYPVLLTPTKYRTYLDYVVLCSSANWSLEMAFY
jgi:hypothetical protein